MGLFNDLELTGIIDVIDFLKPTIIYESLGDKVVSFMTFGMPILFTFALLARYLEESSKSMAGEAKFVVAIKDTMVTCTILASYAVIGVVIIKLIAAIGEKFYEYGSFSVICDTYAEMIGKVQKITAVAGDPAKETNFFAALLKDGTKSVTTFVGWLFFYGTVILFVFVYAFLRLAYCLLYCLCYAWGFVAVPFMLSKKIDVSSGWVRTMLCLLFWPIIESFFYGLFSPLFDQFGSNIILTYSGDKGSLVLLGSVYVLFGITNLVLVAISVSAVFVSFFLSINQSAALGVAAPFLAAAASGANMFKNAAHNIQRVSAINTVRQGVKGMTAAGSGLGKAVGMTAAAVGKTAGAFAGAAENLISRSRAGGGASPVIPPAVPKTGGGSGGTAPAASGAGASGSGGLARPAGAKKGGQVKGGAETGAASQQRGGGDSARNQGGATGTAPAKTGNRGTILKDIQQINAAAHVAGEETPQG